MHDLLVRGGQVLVADDDVVDAVTVDVLDRGGQLRAYISLNSRRRPKPRPMQKRRRKAS